MVKSEHLKWWCEIRFSQKFLRTIFYFILFYLYLVIENKVQTYKVQNSLSLTMRQMSPCSHHLNLRTIKSTPFSTHHPYKVNFKVYINCDLIGYQIGYRSFFFSMISWTFWPHLQFWNRPFRRCFSYYIVISKGFHHFFRVIDFFRIHHL